VPSSYGTNPGVAVERMSLAIQNESQEPVIGEGVKSGNGTAEEGGMETPDMSEKEEAPQPDTLHMNEDEEICRICRCGEEEDRPLFHPCICTGSIKFVHEDCLMEWLAHSSNSDSKRAKCELCGHRFGFTPVYEAGAPTWLTVWEVARLSLVRAIKLIPFALRLVVVALTWGIFIPIATCVMFRILSLGKLDRGGEFQAAFESTQTGWATFFLRLRMALDGGYYSTWAVGVCSSVSIFLSFLTLISVVDFVRAHAENEFFARFGVDEEGEDLDEEEPDYERDIDAPQENNDADANESDNEDENGLEVNGEDDLDGRPGHDLGYANEDPAIVAAALEGSVEDHERNFETDELAQEEQIQDQGQENEQANEEIPREAGAEENFLNPEGVMNAIQNLFANDNNQGVAERQDEDPADQGENAGDDDDEDDEGVGAFLGGGLDGFMDDEEDDGNMNMNPADLDVAMDELLGLRGPGWVLFHNVLWLLTFNGLYLCVTVFAPTTVGAVILSFASRVLEMTTGVRLLSVEKESFLLRTLHKLRAERHAEEKNQALFNSFVWGPFSNYVGPNSLATDQGACEFCLPEDEESLGREEFFEELYLICLEVSAVLLGYIVVATALTICYQCAKWFKDGAARHSTSRLSWSRVTRVLKLMNRTFKVIIIVFLRMGLFPVLLGVLLELASRDMINVHGINRFLFSTEHPVIAITVLWVTGITHMLVITVIVLELRDVLHPDILYGIIRPKYADESLLRTVLEDSVGKHMRRMALSCAIYTVLVMAFIYIPVRLFKASSFGDALPYTPNLKYTLLEVQLPIELACIHIGVLNLLDQGKEVIRDSIDRWFHVTAEALGLAEYLLPIQDSDAPAQVPSTEAPPVDDAHPHDPVDPQLGLKPREKPSYCALRVAAISVLAWITCMVVATCCVAAPLYVGRATVSLLQLPLEHEPLVYGTGCVVLWRACVALLALLEYRAPVIIYKALLRMGERGVTSWPVVKGYLQWLLLGVLSLVVSPWLMGAFVQLIFLLPAHHPSIVGVSSTTGWVFPGQLHNLLVALSGQANQVKGSDLSAQPTWPTGEITDPEVLENMMYLSSSPAHDWMVGFAIELVILQLVHMRDIFPRGNLLQVQRTWTIAIEEMIQGVDCSRMLHDVVLKVCAAQLVVLFTPLLLPGALDVSMSWMAGSKMFSFCIVQAYRSSSATLAVICAAPYVGMEAQKTCLAIHDALRDERYLVGKRLHNLERSQKRFASKRSTVL